MGEMADYFTEREIPWDEDDETEYNPTGRRKSMLEKSEYHPFIWTRANGEKIHIKDMNNHHLGNAIRHLEKSHEGYPMPAVYFNMLKMAKERGLGVTTEQIDRLLEMVTAKKPIKMAIYGAGAMFPGIANEADVLLALEDDGEAITLVVVDSSGDQEYPVLAIHRTGDLMGFELPPDSLLGPWSGPAPADK
jgi:hypothetical protein